MVTMAGKILPVEVKVLVSLFCLVVSDFMLGITVYSCFVFSLSQKEQESLNYLNL